MTMKEETDHLADHLAQLFDFNNNKQQDIESILARYEDTVIS
jgi:hypothetical protein